MVRKIRWSSQISCLMIAFTLLLSAPPTSQAQTFPNSAYQINILQMDGTGLILEFYLTDYHFKEQQARGETYQALEVPGLVSQTQPGQPQLPGLGKLVGMPQGGIEQITLLESNTEILKDIYLGPMPSPPEETIPEQFIFDSALYQQNEFFPASVVDIGMTGQMRDQAVAQLRIIPFQYHPAEKILKVYRRLKIEIRFVPAPLMSKENRSRPNTPYEQLLQSSLLNSAALPPPLPPSPVEISEISTQNQTPALKIFIEEDGLYQVSYEAIQNTGFPLAGIDPDKLHLTTGDRDVALHLEYGSDGIFGPGDILEFYGLAATTKFTDRNVYWLTYQDQPGLRMPVHKATPTGTYSSPTVFYETLHWEENHEYWSHLPNGEGKDHWFWEKLSAPIIDQEYIFTLNHIAQNSDTGSLRITLHGITSNDEITPDHHLEIRVNNHLLDDHWWDGQIPLTLESDISQSLFQEGTNYLSLSAPGDTGAEADSFYLNSFEIGYWKHYIAHNDQLEFTSSQSGLTIFTLDKFGHDSIEVYDISDPYHPRRLTEGKIEASGDKYQIQVQDDTDPEARYLALTPQQKPTPANLLLDTPSSWKSPQHQADYVIITHEDFTASAQRLAEYREAHGLNVALIQITDLYDEFSAGLFTPQAIQDFLSYAYHNWTRPAPLYVVLIGDANYDYKDYGNNNHPNYIPTYLVDSWLIGESPTDNWFVSVAGDDFLPDMFIGRLSVNHPQDAERVVDKIIHYEQAPLADWHQKALFVADNEEDFDQISEQLLDLLPTPYRPHRIYSSDYTESTDSTADIITAIEEGTLIVNFMGHGSPIGWYWRTKGHGGYDIIFDNKTTNESLHNGNLLPFLVTGNCRNGLFALPSKKYTFAENFVRLEEGGGIAAWSPTGLGYSYWHKHLAEELYRQLFHHHNYQLGPATTAAKIEAYAYLNWQEPVEIFTLFGDPALALRVVQPKLRLTPTATTSHIQPGQKLTYIFQYTNEGNYPAQNVELKINYDPHLKYESAQPAPTKENNVWEIDSLPAQTTKTILITVQVPETVTMGTMLTTQASLTQAPYNSTDEVEITIQTEVGRSALQLEGPSLIRSAQAGDFLSYSLRYANHSSQSVEDVELALFHDSYTDQHTAIPSPDQEMLWQLGPLSANDSGSVTMTFRIKPETPDGTILFHRATLSNQSQMDEIIIPITLNYKIHLPFIFQTK